MKLQTSQEIEEIISSHNATIDRMVSEDSDNMEQIRNMVEAVGEMKRRLRLARIEEKLDKLLELSRPRGGI